MTRLLRISFRIFELNVLGHSKQEESFPNEGRYANKLQETTDSTGRSVKYIDRSLTILGVERPA